VKWVLHFSNCHLFVFDTANKQSIKPISIVQPIETIIAMYYPVYSVCVFVCTVSECGLSTSVKVLFDLI